MGRDKRNKITEKMLASQVGQGKAQGLTAKEMIGAGKDTSVARKMFKKGALKAGVRGAALGVVQAEVIEGQIKKAIRHGKTAVRVGKTVMDKFKTKK